VGNEIRDLAAREMGARDAARDKATEAREAVEDLNALREIIIDAGVPLPVMDGALLASLPPLHLEPLIPVGPLPARIEDPVPELDEEFGLVGGERPFGPVSDPDIRVTRDDGWPVYFGPEPKDWEDQSPLLELKRSLRNEIRWPESLQKSFFGFTNREIVAISVYAFFSQFYFYLFRDNLFNILTLWLFVLPAYLVFKYVPNGSNRKIIVFKLTHREVVVLAMYLCAAAWYLIYYSRNFKTMYPSSALWMVLEPIYLIYRYKRGQELWNKITFNRYMDRYGNTIDLDMRLPPAHSI